MYLSRIEIDRYNRNTMKALNSPSIFHGAIESSFAGERKRNLWRIDQLNEQLYVMILSETEPDFSSFCAQFSRSDSSWETKSYNGLLDRIKNGDKWRFRITANPTKSVPDRKDGNRGKVYAHITKDHQKKWIMDRSEKNGFLLTDDSYDVVQEKWFRFYKRESRTISLLAVTYEGILEVTDTELFRNALISGIGRGKAYGMGLITVMHI